jgi:hypothetical protein
MTHAALAIAMLCAAGAAHSVANDSVANDSAANDSAANDSAARYELLDPRACKMPPAPAPPQRKDSYAAYRIERRFLDLDGSGRCVLMEVWIARLGGSASPGMRTLEHRFLRFSGGKWRRFETSLDYFPRVLRARSDNARILVVAPTDEELGDSMLGGAAPRVFSVDGWTEGGAWLALRALDERSEEVLRALAEASAGK